MRAPLKALELPGAGSAHGDAVSCFCLSLSLSLSLAAGDAAGSAANKPVCLVALVGGPLLLAAKVLLPGRHGWAGGRAKGLAGWLAAGVGGGEAAVYRTNPVLVGRLPTWTVTATANNGWDFPNSGRSVAVRAVVRGIQ